MICPECLKPALQKSKGIFTDASWAHWWRYHRKDVREIPSKLAMPVDPDEPRMQQAEQGGEIE
ncbi:hypothetical protein SBA7_880011 [Candidatus Sulfotelmatobacter sp. SbA7]|nr:hypothetical protein SBA7_880011 [Candidatus Sulfotelmatobacter sp. SbA7]